MAREARAREILAEAFATQRAQWSGWFQIVGVFLLLVGFWFLILQPGSEYSSVVNIQKLYVGQTAAIVGAILLAAGVLLKYLG